MKCYLAGAMKGLTAKQASEWREYAKIHLGYNNIKAYSPLRGKPFLGDGLIQSTLGEGNNAPLATSRGLVTRDHMDCTTADVILVNLLGTTAISLGTICEMAWGWDRRIPVVVVCEQDNPHILHPFGAEFANYRVDTLDEGISLVKSLLLPEAANG